MEVKKKAKDAILAAIEQERDGEQIDRSLLKNVLGIFIEVRASSSWSRHLLLCLSEPAVNHCLLPIHASSYWRCCHIWAIAFSAQSGCRACGPLPACFRACSRLAVWRQASACLGGHGQYEFMDLQGIQYEDARVLQHDSG